jgi:hypothetical protein
MKKHFTTKELNKRMIEPFKGPITQQDILHAIESVQRAREECMNQSPMTIAELRKLLS